MTDDSKSKKKTIIFHRSSPIHLHFKQTKTHNKKKTFSFNLNGFSWNTLNWKCAKRFFFFHFSRWKVHEMPYAECIDYSKFFNWTKKKWTKNTIIKIRNSRHVLYSGFVFAPHMKTIFFPIQLNPFWIHVSRPILLHSNMCACWPSSFFLHLIVLQ